MLTISRLRRQDVVKGAADNEGNRTRALLVDDQVYQVDDKPFACGGWGRIFYCSNSADPRRLYVYKELQLQAPRRRSLDVQLSTAADIGREMDALEALHPDVLRGAVDLYGKRFGFVQTLQDGTLADAIPKLRGMRIGRGLLLSRLALHMVQAVLHLHTHDPVMVHNDVKPGNMFYRRISCGIVVRLLDFGMSFELDDADNAPTNTSAYATPESLNGPGSTAADMWGLGLSIMRLAGEHPFQPFADDFTRYDPATDAGRTLRRLSYNAFFAARDGLPMPRGVPSKHAALIRRCWARVDHLNPELRDLVKELLAGDPASRPAAVEAHARLQAANAGVREIPAWHVLPMPTQRSQKVLALRRAYKSLEHDIFVAQQINRERNAHANQQ